jgi:hypothetical protein
MIKGKEFLVVGLFLLVFVIILIAPVVEYTVKERSTGLIIKTGSFIALPGTESLINLENLGEAPKDISVDLKIITGIKKDYYLCTGDIIPTTLPEIKKLCSYMGEETN